MQRSENRTKLYSAFLWNKSDEYFVKQTNICLRAHGVLQVCEITLND